MNHLQIAFGEYGNREIQGFRDNPEILKYFIALGFDASWIKDETSWCAAFVNWVLKQANLPYQNKLNARSFLEIGTPVTVPQLGDVVVFWRGLHKDEFIGDTKLKKGHVGFFIREHDGFIYVLGGNQSNQVKISPYPKYKLLGYRRMVM